ncbi:MAG: hypothetical protein KDH88_07290 [Chromatiales bacterium]|nr:hypothetical protein [Chromatiales bacterium]
MKKLAKLLSVAAVVGAVALPAQNASAWWGDGPGWGGPWWGGGYPYYGGYGYPGYGWGGYPGYGWGGYPGYGWGGYPYYGGYTVPQAPASTSSSK